MPVWLIGVVAVGALFLLTRSRPASPTGIVVRGPVALVGDSIAVGLSRPFGELMRALGLDYFADAEVGTNARQWRSRIDRVLARGPRTVFINLGGNDAASQILTAEFSDNMRAIVDKIRAAGAQPILLEPPSRAAPSFSIIQQGLRSTGAPVLVPPLNIPRASDGIHFTADGYRQWARDIAEMLVAV